MPLSQEMHGYRHLLMELTPDYIAQATMTGRFVRRLFPILYGGGCGTMYNKKEYNNTTALKKASNSVHLPCMICSTDIIPIWRLLCFVWLFVLDFCLDFCAAWPAEVNNLAHAQRYT